MLLLDDTDSSLDDLEIGITETMREMPENELLVDKAWALAHHPGTFTAWHHDCDGKVTAIVPRLGAKLWSVFIPSRTLLPEEVREIMIRLCERKLVCPESHEGSVVTLLLKEGDLL